MCSVLIVLNILEFRILFCTCNDDTVYVCMWCSTNISFNTKIVIYILAVKKNWSLDVQMTILINIIQKPKKRYSKNVLIFSRPSSDPDDSCTPARHADY